MTFSDENEIIAMSCDCPYAKKGDNCKHEAAVLFAYEKEIEKRIVKRKKESYWH